MAGNLSLFFFALFLIAGNSPRAETPLKYSERIIATNVTLNPVVWCGNNLIAVSDKNKGVVLIDLKTRRTIDVKTNLHSGAASCSFDETSLFIADTSHSRADKATGKGIKDFLVYNIKQRRKEGVASAMAGGVLSPDGKAVLFLRPGREFVAKKQPRKWRAYWTQNLLSGERGLEYQWLADSDGIVVRHRDEIFIERFDPPGIFPLKHTLGSQFRRLRVDAHDQVFLLGFTKPGRYPDSLFACKIVVQSELTCHVRIRRETGIAAYEVSRQGDFIVFIGAEHERDWLMPTCIWQLAGNDSRPQCLSNTASTTTSGLSISPDGQWVVFTRHRKLKRTKEGDPYGEYVFDLVAIKRKE